jgi:excinuclease ABC subunit A
MTDYVLDRLVEAGNIVIVIEHTLDVIKNPDWIIDLGAEGGDRGGEIVAEGPPKEIAKSKRSYAGQVLKESVAP